MELLDGGKKKTFSQVKALSSLRPSRSEQPVVGLLLQAGVSGVVMDILSIRKKPRDAKMCMNKIKPLVQKTVSYIYKYLI